ncbi:MAG: hypothetical protein AVDCRST_MAG76-472 [uncultured Acidimicrobiales bacterium]|uniref:Uncharacterized protein n=1 Tax=uncultured Acidimicrobiales bacterium TaxID=310071 RepID=A0A6J4H8X7_9ACTN|nr:MAG: hypothetical protein AVDCRST_MAG76-472 [uncultured Acidimicrobiales bacterium]
MVGIFRNDALGPAAHHPPSSSRPASLQRLAKLDVAPSSPYTVPPSPEGQRCCAARPWAATSTR